MRRRRPPPERISTGQRVAPRCPVFGACGGCAWQDVPYPAQLHAKAEKVRMLLGRLPRPAWREPMAADPLYGYRGKIELTFFGAPGAVSLGFNRRGCYRELVAVDECPIGPPRGRQLIGPVRDWARRRGLPAYDQRTHDGFLRFLMLRQAYGPGRDALSDDDDWIAVLATAGSDRVTGDWGLDDLAGSLPPGGSLVHAVCEQRGGIVHFGDARVVRGNGRMRAALGGVAYELSAESFFQANQGMAERLVALVRERADLRGDEHVLDLFCGVGTLALALAPSAARVTGVEAVASAVADARANARRNGIENAAFEAAAAERYRWERGTVDLALLDPPRGGCHPDLLQRLLDRPVPRILYVSCNPAALARDLEALQRRYHVVFCQCVDLFPQTPHVETVVELVDLE